MMPEAIYEPLYELGHILSEELQLIIAGKIAELQIPEYHLFAFFDGLRDNLILDV
jgi:hypothetical protein